MDKNFDLIDNAEYREFIERLKIEIGQFFRLAEEGKQKTTLALKSRKQSILLRNLLKEYRHISIENEKEIKKMKNNRKESSNE